MDQHISGAVDRIVAEAPPFTDEIREKLRVLLDPGAIMLPLVCGKCGCVFDGVWPAGRNSAVHHCPACGWTFRRTRKITRPVLLELIKRSDWQRHGNGMLILDGPRGEHLTVTDTGFTLNVTIEKEVVRSDGTGFVYPHRISYAEAAEILSGGEP